MTAELCKTVETLQNVPDNFISEILYFLRFLKI